MRLSKSFCHLKNSIKSVSQAKLRNFDKCYAKLREKKIQIQGKFRKTQNQNISPCLLSLFKHECRNIIIVHLLLLVISLCEKNLCVTEKNFFCTCSRFSNRKKCFETLDRYLPVLQRDMRNC